MIVSKPLQDNLGFFLYILVLLFVLCLLPEPAFDPSSDLFLLSVGSIAIWRYLWGLTHFTRAVFYLKVRFPQWRARAEKIKEPPSKIYILATFFRIKSLIAAQTLHSIVQEAVNLRCPVMIILSIVEAQDEEMIEKIVAGYELPALVSVHVIRVAGKGKRYGLAQGLRVISRDLPDDDALCVFMDGDTVLMPDSLKRAAPFFQSMPEIGALTTDELGMLDGAPLMADWYNLRFAQRHLLMSSMSLSKRVMTLTGRMSMFRASIVSSPEFIRHIEDDHLQHWRLGRIPFLTGDDKSSLYFVMKENYAQIYLPDVKVITHEDPPGAGFVKV